jgi:hypothetical protein
VKRLLRYLFALVSLVFLTLFVTTCWLWYRSHRGPDVIHYTSEKQWAMVLISGHGTVDVLYLAHWPQEPEFRRSRYDPNVYYGTRYSKRKLGFGTDISPSGGRYVNIPHWFLATLFLVTAALTARASWKSRRKPTGVCRRCGYDLRASPDRCPECGTAAAGAV